MQSSRGDLLTVVRILFVGIGVTGTALAAYRLGSMPPPSPNGDGTARGMAALFGGAVAVFTLGLAAVGVSLPALLGRDDPLGFTRFQRLALKAGGVFIGGAILVGLVSGLVPGMRWGILLSFGLVAIAILVVAATLGWRFAELLARFLHRAAGRGR